MITETREQQRQALDNLAKAQANAMTVPYCYQCNTKLAEKMFELPEKCPGCGRATWMVKLQYK